MNLTLGAIVTFVILVAVIWSLDKWVAAARRWCKR